jgi:hypothetical protein
MYPMAIFFPVVGEGIPEVITPVRYQGVNYSTFYVKARASLPIIAAPSEVSTSHPSRAGDPVISNPTRRRAGPSFNSFKILEAPGKSPAARLSLPAHTSYISIKVKERSKSLTLTDQPS